MFGWLICCLGLVYVGTRTTVIRITGQSDFTVHNEVWHSNGSEKHQSLNDLSFQQQPVDSLALFGPHPPGCSLAASVALSLFAEVVELTVLQNLYPHLSVGVDWGYVAADETGLVVVTMAGLEQLFAPAMTTEEESLELFLVPS